MKQSEIQKCIVCGEGVMKCGLPTFYKVKIERFIVDIAAIRRQHGLEMSMGDAAPLAQIMGPNEDIAGSVSEETTSLICEQCACEENMFAYIAEKAATKEIEKDGQKSRA
jgi:hypothetical protein